MSDLEKAFKEIRRIAHELVDAEELPAWERNEQAAINKAREKPLIAWAADSLTKLGKRIIGVAKSVVEIYCYGRCCH